MKKTSILLLTAVMTVASCGTSALFSSSDNGQRFQDGIYNSSPSLRTKEQKVSSKSETEALAQKTRESEIYIFGDKKDTIMIPQNMSARIQFDRNAGGTTVTVGENPYDWWNGYYYGPYSIGSSWYWSRHWYPYWSTYWYSPWRHYSFYDPWYYGGFYDPWYCGGWYDPWHYGGCWSWYHPLHHHHHHGWYDPHFHHPGPGHAGLRPDKGTDRWYGMRAQTGSASHRTAGNVQRAVTRRGIGTSSSSSRSSSVSRASSGSRQSAARTSAPTYRRPSSSSGKSYSGGTAGYTRSSGSTYTRGSSSSSSPSYDRGSSSGYSRSGHTSGQTYSRGSSSSGSSGYSRGSSSGGGYSRGGSSSGGGSYSRGSSGSYRR